MSTNKFQDEKEKLVSSIKGIPNLLSGVSDGSLIVGVRLRKISDQVRQKNIFKKWTEKISIMTNALLATEFSQRADSYLRDTFAGVSNVYDRAMDAARNESGHLGPDHRLYDGGHSLTEAWERVQAAVPDDGFIQEVAGYITAIKNDVITPEGLPFKTLDKESVKKFVEETGISYDWARDIASYTATEIAGAGIAALSLALNWNQDDRDGFAKYLGAIGFSSIASASPVLGVLTLSAAAIEYQKRTDKRAFMVSSAKGAIPTAAFVATSGLVGGPVAVGMLAGIVAAIICSTKMNKKGERSPEMIIAAENYAANKLSKIDWKKIKAYRRTRRPDAC